MARPSPPRLLCLHLARAPPLSFLSRSTELWQHIGASWPLLAAAINISPRQHASGRAQLRHPLQWPKNPPILPVLRWRRTSSTTARPRLRPPTLPRELLTTTALQLSSSSGEVLGLERRSSAMGIGGGMGTWGGLARAWPWDMSGRISAMGVGDGWSSAMGVGDAGGAGPWRAREQLAEEIGDSRSLGMRRGRVRAAEDRGGAVPAWRRGDVLCLINFFSFIFRSCSCNAATVTSQSAFFQRGMGVQVR